MELFVNQEECCGCAACKDICPRQAIVMKPDREGFLYPEIIASLCMDCGMCRQVCSFCKPPGICGKLAEPDIYAVKHQVKEVLLTSSSGGVFTALSDQIIACDGAVYGSAFDSDFRVRHERAVTPEERDKFKGSKYVQSDMATVFDAVKKDLQSGISVLFTGTPCQNAALNLYIDGRAETSGLYLCDIVCHGVPSPLMWKEYVDFLEAENNSKLSRYQFRSKKFGWGYTEHAFYEDGRNDCESIVSQIYKKFFLKNYYLRPSCYHCRYTNFDRPSDITIADFWGIQKSMPDFNDVDGVSLVIVNTQKGQKLFDSVKKDVIFKKSSREACIQGSLRSPVCPPPEREEFWNDYHELGYRYVIHKYSDFSVYEKIKGSEIVIFGAGAIGRELVGDPVIRERLLFFIDNDVTKQKSGFRIGNRKYDVCSVMAAIDWLSENTVIIITGTYGKDMAAQLHSLGIKSKIVMIK